MPRFSYEKGIKPNYTYNFPFGLCYIYSVIKNAGYDLEAYNLNHEEGHVEDLIEKKLNDTKYDIVCVGGMSLDYEVIEKIINACKLHTSKPLIILGGSILIRGKQLVAESLNFDIGVVGEGENTILELLKNLKKKKSIEKINGICYKKENKIIFTPPREPILNLDSIPFPDFGAFGFDKVLDHMSSGELFGCSRLDYPRTYPVLGSRGCPFQCTFCYHSTGPRYRIRSVKNIIEEIEYAIKKYDINSFNLSDDLFAVQKERLCEFCKEIKRLNEKYSKKLVWMCQLWVGVVDKEILTILKDAGCVIVVFGFESYSEKVLKSMKKPITPKQIDNAIKKCFESNMTFIGNFIFGDLAETKETVRETIDYWKENCRGQARLFFIHPYPGSEIYESCLKREIIKDELNFIKNEMQHTNIRNMTLSMSDKEFEELKKEVYDLTSKGPIYSICSKVKKEKEDRYEVSVKCPHCGKENVIKNCLLKYEKAFSLQTACRHCGMKFYLCNRLYKFTMKHYVQLDFIRKNYLLFRDKFLKSRM